LQNPVSLMRAPILIFWTVILSLFTAVLGAAPLRVLRLTAGQGAYWLISICLIGLSVGLNWMPLALILGVNTILVGCYTEFEERDFNLRQAAGFAVLITVLLLASGFYVWTTVIGKVWLQQVTTIVEGFLLQAQSLKINALSQVQAQDIIVQLPSAVFIFMILSLALALILESRFTRFINVRLVRREKLSEFQAPDALVWVFIFSLLGAFAQLGIKPLEVISLNTLNVCVVIYFFQGLAVMGAYFEAFRISIVWRVLWVVLLVFQLPILMSILGLVDYWAEFRRVFVKRAAQLKKKRIQD
jgi:hypothetical protein